MAQAQVRPEMSAGPTPELTPDVDAAATPPAEVRRKRGRPRDPEADARILAAASSLILLRGYESMTVDEVASSAGVGKATVYRRWSRKEDLAVAAMEQLYRDEMPPPDTGSIRGDLLRDVRLRADLRQLPRRHRLRPHDGQGVDA